MRLKNDTINPQGMRPEILLALLAADEVYKKHNKRLIITSINDSKHSRTSLHYLGLAVDLRTVQEDPDYNWDKVAQEIRYKLNEHYDVINESNHIHIEFQVKG